MPTTRYRQLDDTRIQATLARLRDRITERFPDSSLSRVAIELQALGNETSDFARRVSRPVWSIRLGVALAIATMVLVLALGAWRLRPAAGIDTLDGFVQAIEATISTVVFLGAAVYFLVTLEDRLKRRRALGTLHQLRSVAHVVDMHQLTKDPVRITPAHRDTPSSPERTLTPADLGRYLDYCSELLSVIGKLAALHVQHFNDPVTLAAVNDIESLTVGLSNKIWQKITLLDQGRGVVPRPPGPGAG